MDEVCPVDTGPDKQPERTAAANADEQSRGGAQALPVSRSKWDRYQFATFVRQEEMGKKALIPVKKKYF